MFFVFFVHRHYEGIFEKEVNVFKIFKASSFKFNSTIRLILVCEVGFFLFDSVQEQSEDMSVVIRVPPSPLTESMFCHSYSCHDRDFEDCRAKFFSPLRRVVDGPASRDEAARARNSSAKPCQFRCSVA